MRTSADALANAGAPGNTDAERAAWLADKIAALGDYAKEAASMLLRWPSADALANVPVDGGAAVENRLKALMLTTWTDMENYGEKFCEGFNAGIRACIDELNTPPASGAFPTAHPEVLPGIVQGQMNENSSCPFWLQGGKKVNTSSIPSGRAQDDQDFRDGSASSSAAPSAEGLDRELLEKAGEAFGFDHISVHADGMVYGHDGICNPVAWNPLQDDGDALRLAVEMRIDIEHDPLENCVHAVCGIESREWVDYGDDPTAATRRAIVRAAAKLGEQQ